MKSNFCVLFDLDNTLLDFNKAERQSLIKTYKAFNYDISDAQIKSYNCINTLYWERLERGEISRNEVLIGRFNLFHEECHLNLDSSYIEDLYEKNLAKNAFFMPGALELLKQIEPSYRLFIVTNGTKCIQESRLNIAEIYDCFENIFISETIGFEKPSIQFFNSVLDSIQDVDIDQTIIIGDSLTSDIKGGIDSGIKTCWFNYSNKINESNILPTYIINQLSEVPSLLNIIKN